MKNKILKLVQNILVAERNDNMNRAYLAHQKLYDFCQKNNINLENALEGAKKILKQQPANIMQGIGVI